MRKSGSSHNVLLCLLHLLTHRPNCGGPIQMLRGDLNVSRTVISGWAQDSDQADMPISLLVMDNDELIGRVLANQYRADLENAGIGNGRHAFELRITAGLSFLTWHVIRACREEDGLDISNSPTVLEPATAFDETTEPRLAALLAATMPDAELIRRIHFLVTETDKLLQLRADHQSNRAQRI